MVTLLKILPFLWTIWPVVVDAVRTVEGMAKTASGDVKKAMVKRFVQERIPNAMARFGMKEKDWDSMLGGVIDIIVAFLNWRNLW